MLKIAASIASYSGASEPGRQYGPSVWFRSHVMSQGGVSSSRVRHSSSHPSPRSPTSGGIAFIATWLTPYWDSSLAVTQPPM